MVDGVVVGVFSVVSDEDVDGDCVESDVDSVVASVEELEVEEVVGVVLTSVAEVEVEVEVEVEFEVEVVGVVLTSVDEVEEGVVSVDEVDPAVVVDVVMPVLVDVFTVVVASVDVCLVEVITCCKNVPVLPLTTVVTVLYPSGATSI